MAADVLEEVAGKSDPTDVENRIIILTDDVPNGYSHNEFSCLTTFRSDKNPMSLLVRNDDDQLVPNFNEEVDHFVLFRFSNSLVSN